MWTCHWRRRSRQSWIPEHPSGSPKGRWSSTDFAGKANNPVLHRRSPMSPETNRYFSKTSRETTPRIFSRRGTGDQDAVRRYFLNGVAKKIFLSGRISKIMTNNKRKVLITGATAKHGLSV